MFKLVIAVYVINVSLLDGFFINSKDIRNFFGFFPEAYEIYKKEASHSNKNEEFYYPLQNSASSVSTKTKTSQFEENINQKLEKLEHFAKNKSNKKNNHRINDYSNYHYTSDNKDDIYNREYSNNQEQVKLLDNEHIIKNPGRHHKTHNCHRHNNSPVHGIRKETTNDRREVPQSKKLTKGEMDFQVFAENPHLSYESVKDHDVIIKSPKNESDYISGILVSLPKALRKNKEPASGENEYIINEDNVRYYLKPFDILHASKEEELLN